MTYPEAAHVVSSRLPPTHLHVSSDILVKICVSACKDDQKAWEGPNGVSITMVRALSNPSPCLNQLSILGIDWYPAA